MNTNTILQVFHICELKHFKAIKTNCKVSELNYGNNLKRVSCHLQQSRALRDAVRTDAVVTVIRDGKGKNLF